jgi:hypothetical protein
MKFMVCEEIKDPPATTTGPSELETLKIEHQKLLEKLKGLDAKPQVPIEDPSLADKAKIERERLDKEKGSVKEIEDALKFSLQAPEWLKTNAPLLPKNIADIFTAADKETYRNTIEKSNAIKSGIIQEFFAIQTNLDLLTGSQKIALEEFKKLTKDVKETKAKELYDSLFEPTFEMMKKIERAKEISRGGVTPSDAESAYKQRMAEISQKQFLGAKK